MRKLLLASAALLGGFAGTVSVAQAEALVNIQQPAGLPGALPVQPGIQSTATPGVTPQMPGTITVRINARVLAYAYAGYDSGRNPVVTPVAGSATSLGSPASNGKLAAYNFGSYARIYPSVDGVAANGLKYGGFLEIRQDSGGPPGGGMNGSISGSNRTRAALYFRREYGYVGSDALGTLRFGSVDQPTSYMMTGSFENFDDGGWNGDVPGFFTGGSAPLWNFSDVGALYTTNKLAYQSPVWGPIDFGVSYEPTTAGMANGPGNCPYSVTANAGIVASSLGGNSALGCDATSSTTTGDYTRRRNTVDTVLRYRAAFGPVGIAATVGGMYGGKVLDNSTPAKLVQYDGLQVFDSGIQLTFGGLAVGGHIDYGRFNPGGGAWALAPQGTPDAFQWLVGASYAIGPFIAGFHYFDSRGAGSKTAVSGPYVGNIHQQGLAVGTTYQFAPGMNVFVSALYGERHEGGVDLLSGATSSLTTKVNTNNNTKAAGIGIGTLFRW